MIRLEAGLIPMSRVLKPLVRSAAGFDEVSVREVESARINQLTRKAFYVIQTLRW